MRWLITLLLASTLASVATGQTPRAAESAGIPGAKADNRRAATDPTRVDTAGALWAAYTARYAGESLQVGCLPRRYLPPPDTAVRGIVLMYHGFGACPQQYWQLGPMMAAAGYEVLVPLLPGHGRPPAPDGQDDLLWVPVGSNWQAGYGRLASEMNAIVAAAPGTRIVVGYSLGGAIALYGLLDAPALYERALLLAPLLGIRGGTAIENLASVAGTIPGVRKIVVKPDSARQACIQWQLAGRAGFCDYRLEHVTALVRLMRDNQRRLLERPVSRPVQVVVAGGDTIIDNQAIEDFVAAQMAHGSIVACHLPADVPHEILTPYENIGREMYWLDALLALSGAFIRSGEAIADPIGNCALAAPGAQR